MRLRSTLTKFQCTFCQQQVNDVILDKYAKGCTCLNCYYSVDKYNKELRCDVCDELIAYLQLKSKYTPLAICEFCREENESRVPEKK